MNRKLVSIQLINGWTVLSQAEEYANHYILHNPVRPTLTEQGIAYPALNPFSDTTKYTIRKDHTITCESMHFKFIDIYFEAVQRIEQGIKNDYNNLTQEVNTDSIQLSDEYAGTA